MSVVFKKPGSIKNVGIISTRIAGTDGVSLEIKKWADILEKNGFNCFYFGGELDRDHRFCYACELAYFKHPDIDKITQWIFGSTTRSIAVSNFVEKVKVELKRALYTFIKEFNIDLIIPENVLSIPMNIPLGLGITECIAELSIPAIAHHHDFFWERERFLINACEDYLRCAFPPDLRCIRHVVINSLASKQLNYRLGISNTVIPNVYDFTHPPQTAEKKISELKQMIGLAEDDLFILQPTRIVPRKSIERSIEIVSGLNLSNPTLVISHTSGDEGNDYFQRINEYAHNYGVKITAIDHLISPRVHRSNASDDLFTITELYQSADIVTYPSGYEGFGNAFLETIYFKKPIIVNRYPIFIADIEPKGFDVLTFDGFVTAKIISQIQALLDDKKRKKEIVDKNYKLAQRYFSYEILEKKLMYLINTLV